MEFNEFGKYVLVAGLILVVAGIAIMLAGRLPIIGQLPGDFTFRRGNTTIFVPLATMLLLSLLLTIAVNLVIRR